jgi:hypothetical protein
MVAELTRYVQVLGYGERKQLTRIALKPRRTRACRQAGDCLPRRGSLRSLSACRQPRCTHRSSPLPVTRSYWHCTRELPFSSGRRELTQSWQIGGATGSVGDPSGRSTERNALSSSELNVNIRAITKQLTTFLTRGVPFALSRNQRRDGAFLEDDKTGAIQVENNLDWLGGMGLLEFLSTVGKTARISTMLSRERWVISLDLEKCGR